MFPSNGPQHGDKNSGSVFLTPQEVNVLQLLASGFETTTIAEKLELDPRTVQNYITLLRRKTRCSTRVALVRWYHDFLASSVLTTQELNVLKLLVEAIGTKAIAEALYIDPRSVQNYVVAIRRKTGCRTHTELVQWYRRVYLGEEPCAPENDKHS